MRVFFAIEPDPESRHQLEILVNRARPYLLNCGRLTDIRDLHLTLIFIGEWPNDKMGVLTGLLEQIGTMSKPFSITFDQFGFFDHGRKNSQSQQRPVILWLGSSAFLSGGSPPNEDRQTLIDLVWQLRQSARSMGVQVESRPFAPHLTLTRKMPAEQAQNIVASLPSFEPIRFNVTTLTLMLSVPDDGHMRYDPVMRVSLAGR